MVQHETRTYKYLFHLGLVNGVINIYCTFPSQVGRYDIYNHVLAVTLTYNTSIP